MVFGLSKRTWTRQDICSQGIGVLAKDLVKHIAERRKKMDECCGTCKYHVWENYSMGWVCCCADSEYLSDWTEYEDKCDEWEERISGDKN